VALAAGVKVGVARPVFEPDGDCWWGIVVAGEWVVHPDQGADGCTVDIWLNDDWPRLSSGMRRKLLDFQGVA
jgi:hypothetical protein